MRRDLVRLRRKLHHSAAFREICRMEASKLGACFGIVELWSGQNEARFGLFETKLTLFCSISRDLSNGTL